MMTCIEKIESKWREGKFVCVGLDPVWDKLPPHLTSGAKEHGDPGVVFLFCKEIIDQTKDIVNSYKPNSAFFEAFGSKGIVALEKVCAYISETTDVPIILDAKRGDIGTTNEGYATFLFDILKADAITIHPWLGSEANVPFLERKDKAIIVLCKTSNPGSDQFQNKKIDGLYAYEEVAQTIATIWNTHRNCMLVVGATYPEELAKVRALVGLMPILVPGIGAQGGDLEATLQAGLTSERQDGLIISSSRGIIYASSQQDYATYARAKTLELHNEIDHIRRSLAL